MDGDECAGVCGGIGLGVRIGESADLPFEGDGVLLCGGRSATQDRKKPGSVGHIAFQRGTAIGTGTGHLPRFERRSVGGYARGDGQRLIGSVVRIEGFSDRKRLCERIVSDNDEGAFAVGGIGAEEGSEREERLIPEGFLGREFDGCAGAHIWKGEGADFAGGVTRSGLYPWLIGFEPVDGQIDRFADAIDRFDDGGHDGYVPVWGEGVERIIGNGILSGVCQHLDPAGFSDIPGDAVGGGSGIGAFGEGDDGFGFLFENIIRRLLFDRLCEDVIEICFRSGRMGIGRMAEEFHGPACPLLGFAVFPEKPVGFRGNFGLREQEGSFQNRAFCFGVRAGAVDKGETVGMGRLFAVRKKRDGVREDEFDCFAVSARAVDLQGEAAFFEAEFGEEPRCDRAIFGEARRFEEAEAVGGEGFWENLRNFGNDFQRQLPVVRAEIFERRREFPVGKDGSRYGGAHHSLGESTDGIGGGAGKESAVRGVVETVEREGRFQVGASVFAQQVARIAVEGVFLGRHGGGFAKGIAFGAGDEVAFFAEVFGKQAAGRFACRIHKDIGIVGIQRIGGDDGVIEERLGNARIFFGVRVNQDGPSVDFGEA